MKNLLALVGAAVVLVVGLGWYLGWYKLGVDKGTPGHPKINVEVESDKVEADGKKVKKAVGEFIKDHENGKGVPGQSTSLPLNPDGTFTVPQLPPLPPLPPPPSAPGVVDPSTIIIPPPPTFVPGKQ